VTDFEGNFSITGAPKVPLPLTGNSGRNEHPGTTGVRFRPITAIRIEKTGLSHRKKPIAHNNFLDFCAVNLVKLSFNDELI
jgi:hypothetical protein